MTRQTNLSNCSSKEVSSWLECSNILLQKKVVVALSLSFI